MDASAKVTSEGQITIPKEVQNALGITEGDHIDMMVLSTAAPGPPLWWCSTVHTSSTRPNLGPTPAEVASDAVE